jgi:hypothetical protein
MKASWRTTSVKTQKARNRARRSLLILVFSIFTLAVVAASEGATYPKPNYFNNSVGFLRWNNGLTAWRGSGCVAWDPRLLGFGTISPP